MKHNYTREEDEYLFQNHKEKAYKELASDLGLTINQVRHRIDRHIKNNFIITETPWSDSEIDILTCNAHKSYEELSILLPTKRKRTIEEKIRELNLPREHGNRIHFVNKNYFNHPTHNSYYILYLFAADGCLFNDNSHNKYKVYIALHKDDKGLLEKIALELGSDISAVHTRKNAKMSELVLYSESLYNSLKSLGIIERKSLLLKRIDTPSEFFCSAARGIFDGDGSIMLYKYKNYIKPVVQFLETYDFLFGLAQNLTAHLGINIKTPKKTHTNCYTLRYYTKQARTILDWMYSPNIINKSLCLKRKYNKYLYYKNSCPQFYN